MSRPSGRGRQLGRQNRPRGCPTLPVFCAGQEETCGCAHSRECDWLSLDCHRRANHIRDPGRAVRSGTGRRGWHEGSMCGEPAQCSYCLSKSTWETRCAIELLANARNMPGSALFSRMRCELIGDAWVVFTRYNQCRPLALSPGIPDPAGYNQIWRACANRLRPPLFL
jgi:hypothetical protein